MDEMMNMRCLIAIVSLVMAASCGAPPSGTATPASSTMSAATADPAALQSWRVVLVAGDNSIPVFDNAVDALRGILAGKPGVEVRMLTSDLQRQAADRPIATADSIDGALQGSAAQGCFVYLTSHGSEEGLLLHEDFDNHKTLSPSRLDRILDRECGARPTVVVVSACHSGVFIGRPSKADNRIWLTAAREDRVSFGCGAEFQYTYFDNCVLSAWPKSRTFQQLFDRTETCVRLRESELSQAPSMPQAFFGAGVKDLALP
jgi:hypothetical protein